jgi:hypothetical protein
MSINFDEPSAEENVAHPCTSHVHWGPGRGEASFDIYPCLFCDEGVGPGTDRWNPGHVPVDSVGRRGD